MLKVTMKTPERRQWRRYGVFIFNFMYLLSRHCFIYNFEH